MTQGNARGEVVVLETPELLAAKVADRIVDEARYAIERRGAFRVALAGGTTPKAAYALLAAAPRRDAVLWNDVRFFFGDERCVGPEDEQSNYHMAKVAMLDALGIVAAHVFRMHGEDDPKRAAAAYADVVRRELGSPPVFDLVLLGMGPDGHTASLFPGNPLPGPGELVAAPWVEKFKTFRLTLAPHAINAARAVVISAEGDGKAEALARALEAPLDTAQTPIQAIRPENGKLTWYVDKAAAARLNKGVERPTS